MKEHRITSCGNSSAVTLAQDELNHLDCKKGDLVTISKMGSGNLIIRKQILHKTLRNLKRINHKIP